MDRVTKFLVTVGLLALWLTTGTTYANDNTHVVEPGETLSEIAVAYGTNVETLRSLNDLSDIDLVWVGLPLTLPLDALSDTSDAEIAAFGPDSYTVQIGDTLSSIATAHSMSLAQLVALNRISPAQSLFAGEVLALQESVQSVSETRVSESGISENGILESGVLENGVFDQPDQTQANQTQAIQIQYIQTGSM